MFKNYSKKHKIPLANIKVVLCYIGLKTIVNTGEVTCELYDKQPLQKVFYTTLNHIQQILEWKKNPESFLIDLKERKTNDQLINYLVEQYEFEN